jgi:DNA-binding NtrC family response regulator
MERVLAGHELVHAKTVEQALRSLRKGGFDLVVCTVLFDDSRMFDLLRLVREEDKWADLLFVCARARHNVLDTPVALEAVGIACRALAADAFLNISDYGRQNPEDGMKKEIEKLLKRRNRTDAARAT